LDLVKGDNAGDAAKAPKAGKGGKGATKSTPGAAPASTPTNGQDSAQDEEDIFANFEFSSTDNFAYAVTVWFDEGSSMENLRAFELVNRLQKIAVELRHIPPDIDGEAAMLEIQKNGVIIVFASEMEIEEVKAYMEQTPLMKKYELYCKNLKPGNTDGTVKAHSSIPGFEAAATLTAEIQQAKQESAAAQQQKAISAASAPAAPAPAAAPATPAAPATAAMDAPSSKQGIISVNIAKLDKLMDLVGELVTSESMVSQNPDLNGLQLDNFNKAARQLQKIINELQDVSMSVRMVPLSLTFQKMHRIVRAMCRKLGKEVTLEIIGEETEVDKNIIEHITNPLMHLIRNAVDHGIEMPDDRLKHGKTRSGVVTLEAKNESGDVWIIVKDDGYGLNKEKIYDKARKNGITQKNFDELTDREINSFVLAAGFSTNEEVTEFSGRGVGMDVVVKGLEAVGGNVILESTEGHGTVISIKIPLTLAIMDGLIVNVGETSFVIPITSIRESFKADAGFNIADVNNETIIMIRGEPNPIVKLKDRFSLKSTSENFYDGVMILVENEIKSLCLYVDAILGQRQVVVKPLPEYIKEVKGISGCTLLGDGTISLILDVADFLS
jgi:two-component system chemotaxis sensor kinase CheA